MTSSTMPELNGDKGPARNSAVVRFGVFELDLRTGELRKHGVKLKLQPKSFQLLQALLERPGQLVTRDELRARLWSSDVFVDVESGLNTAANRLRIALGDSADNPRYIETLARAGYRFIAPITTVNGSSSTSDVEPAATATQKFRWPVTVAIAAAALVVLAVSGVIAWRSGSSAEFQFHQLTFRRGQVSAARFAPDGRTILYTARWDTDRSQLFLTNPFSPESRALGFDDLRLVAVSRSGELAFMTSDGLAPLTGGTLSRVPMNGGSPLPIERNVMAADWSPAGGLAIVRAEDGVNKLEFPVGHLLHKTAGWMSSIRFSPKGDAIAFIEHPIRHDDRGTVKLAALNGAVRSLSPVFAAARGLAWHPSGREVWFTASIDSGANSLWRVTMSGRVRPLANVPGAITLRDIAPDGRVLASRDTATLEMAAITDGDPRVRNLSWLDWSRVVDISNDGRLVLFDESGVAAGSDYRVYVHKMDDHSTTRLGNGQAMALSPDGRSALIMDVEDRTHFRLISLANGTTLDLPATGLEYQWARYFPDGNRLIALASKPNQPLRLYVQPLSGKPFPITPPIMTRSLAVSPGGTEVAVLSAEGRLAIYPVVEGGRARVVPTHEPLAPLLWTANESLYVAHVGPYTQIPTRISRLDLASGRLEKYQDVGPTDLVGVNAITKVMLSGDARTIVFNYRRVLSELFVADPAR